MCVIKKGWVVDLLWFWEKLNIVVFIVIVEDILYGVILKYFEIVWGLWDNDCIFILIKYWLVIVWFLYYFW